MLGLFSCWTPTFMQKGSYETASVSWLIVEYVNMPVGQLSVFIKNSS